MGIPQSIKFPLSISVIVDWGGIVEEGLLLSRPGVKRAHRRLALLKP